MTATIHPPTTSHNSLIITDITWEQLERIESTLAEIGGLRFSYLDGNLAVMNLSLDHEEAKFIISALLEAYMRFKGIRFYGRGSATLGSKEIGGKKEPDESYNIKTKKAIPDLVIEVVVTSGGINTLELYQRIGIPEVWFWEDGVLKVYRLQGTYQRVEKSVLLPDLDINTLTKYITYHDQYDAVREFLKVIS